MKGVQEWLLFYFKSPQTTPALPRTRYFIQLKKLKNTLRHLWGEESITHLGQRILRVFINSSRVPQHVSRGLNDRAMAALSPLFLQGAAGASPNPKVPNRAGEIQKIHPNDLTCQSLW